MLTLFAPDPDATAAIGTALAACLVPGDTVALAGDLGTGKTALARAIIRARLDDPDLDVPSPSFAIVQPYLGLVHVDLYRITDEAEIFELGILEDEEAVLLVEWPQNAPLVFDRDGYKITFSMHPSEGRLIGIRTQGARDLAPMEAALAPWRAPEAD